MYICYTYVHPLKKLKCSCASMCIGKMGGDVLEICVFDTVTKRSITLCILMAILTIGHRSPLPLCISPNALI